MQFGGLAISCQHPVGGGQLQNLHQIWLNWRQICAYDCGIRMLICKIYGLFVFVRHDIGIRRGGLTQMPVPVPTSKTFCSSSVSYESSVIDVDHEAYLNIRINRSKVQFVIQKN